MSNWKQPYTLSGCYTCASDGRLRRSVTLHSSWMLYLIKKGKQDYRVANGGKSYAFVSFYTHLQALLCRAYPLKAQWDVTMCLCLLFHLQASLCAWNFGAHPHAFQPEVNVPRQAEAWADPAEDCLHLLTHVPISFSIREQRKCRYFKTINMENIYSAFCTEQSSDLWVTDSPWWKLIKDYLL